MRPHLFIFFATLFSTTLVGQVYGPLRFEQDDRTVDLPEAMRLTNTPVIATYLDYGVGMDTSFYLSTDGTAVDENALYAAGAASAAPVAVAILQLVERGAIGLDDDVNDHLKTVKLTVKKGKTVTVRDLLLMKAKLGTAYKPAGTPAGEKGKPVAEQIQEMRYRGKLGPLASSQFGGWLLLQQLLEDHYGKDFASLMEEQIFAPLGLRNTFYATTLSPEQQKRIAVPHDDDGNPLAYGYRSYVEQASGGLWTTPRDFTRFARSVMDAARGGESPLLSPAMAAEGWKTAFGHRSLLFHKNKKNAYWGGNSVGYYFQMTAAIEDDYVAVSIMNRNLNWRLGGPVMGQLGLLVKQYRSTDELVIFTSPDDDEEVIREIEHFAFYVGIKCRRQPVSEGAPAEITATPAFVFQNEKGRAIYSGRHDDREAIERFLRSSRVAPKAPAKDERRGELIRKEGRQSVSFPLKVTSPLGEELLARLERNLAHSLAAERCEIADLQPLDRRFYVDVHPYREVSGDYAMTYAIFSQFNCHTPVATNYGTPLKVNAAGRGMDELTADIAAQLRPFLNAEAGFLPTGIDGGAAVIDWAEAGLPLAKSVAAAQAVDRFLAPAEVSGRYAVEVTPADAPALFFSFPSPLDRYAGEVTALKGSFDFGDAGESVTARFELPVASIKTSSAPLDEYVLGDLLKQKKYPTAVLEIPAVELPGDWKMEGRLEQALAGTLTMRGRSVPVELEAAFTPQADGSLLASAAWAVSFKSIFMREGPDGPPELKDRLEFRSELTARP